MNLWEKVFLFRNNHQSANCLETMTTMTCDGSLLADPPVRLHHIGVAFPE